MKIYSKKTIFLIWGLILLLTPMALTYATDYVLLEPSIIDNKSATSQGLTIYLQYLYNSFFAFIAIASFFLIVWGGFEYVTSSIPGMKADGRAKINRALTGFGIALFAWLLLETISAGTFTNIDLSLQNIGGTSFSAGPAGTGGGTNQTPATAGNNQTGTASGASDITEAEARKRFEDLGIPVNAQPPQTQLAGIQQDTIDAVVNMKEDSGCNFIITGGTEDTGVHSTSIYGHTNGYKVDIDDNPCMNNYFTGWTKIAPRTDRVNGQSVLVPRYQNGNIIAADERNVPTRGSHWDIQVKPN